MAQPVASRQPDQGETVGAPALAIQLYTVRDALAADAAGTLGGIAGLGVTGVEPVCATGLSDDLRRDITQWTVPAAKLRRLLDDNGLVVASAHTALPDGPHAEAILDEQELLGNTCLVVSSLYAVRGAGIDDLEHPDTLKRLAERFNRAAERAARRGMRIGYHNHYWEWRPGGHGRPGYDVWWDHLDPAIVAEVDIYWAHVAGADPASVIGGLGQRVELLHVKDGPGVLGPPMTAVGEGEVDVDAALAAGKHVRWHIIEMDECAGDVLATVRTSVEWLTRSGRYACR